MNMTYIYNFFIKKVKIANIRDKNINFKQYIIYTKLQKYVI